MNSTTPTKAERRRPSSITFQGILVIDWRCPQCGTPNTSQRPAETKKLNVKCGCCHVHTILAYDREHDAPLEAINYARSDVAILGRTRYPSRRHP